MANESPQEPPSVNKNTRSRGREHTPRGDHVGLHQHPADQHSQQYGNGERGYTLRKEVSHSESNF